MLWLRIIPWNTNFDLNLYVSEKKGKAKSLVSMLSYLGLLYWYYCNILLIDIWDILCLKFLEIILLHRY